MKIFFAFILCCTAKFLSAQTAFTYLFHEVDTNTYAYVHSVHREQDGNFRMTGMISKSSVAHAFNIKVSAAGNIVSQNILRGDSAQGFYFGASMRTSDSGYLFLASSVAHKVGLLKTDSAGTPSWFRLYSDSVNFNYGFVNNNLVEADSSYYIYGSYHNVPSGMGSEGVILRVDYSGYVIEEVGFGGQDAASEVPRAIMKTQDGAIVTTSSIYPYFSNGYYYAIGVQKWDTELNLLWSKRYSFNYIQVVNSIIPLSDSCLLVIGYHNVYQGPVQQFIFKLDPDGNVLWGKCILPGQASFLRAIELPDHSFILHGINNGTIVSRYNSSGNFLSAAQLTGFPGGYNLMERENANDDLLMVGPTMAGMSDHRLYFLRMDSAYNAACNVLPFTISDSSLSVTDGVLAIATTPFNITHIDSVLFPSPLNIVVSNLCLPTGIDNQTNSSDVAIYPNPSADELIISGAFSKGEINIYNALGEKILSREIAVGEKEVKLNVKNFTAGIYVVRISDEKLHWAGKFVKE
ncbi:MAG TPA: T9SS type A sorting domain-containing protein [Bacteroidia bacterium]|nr:T9SS type A sorting domain-containing protein [Bacteroidia bacterium]